MQTKSYSKGTLGALWGGVLVMLLALSSLAKPDSPYKAGDKVDFSLRNAEGKQVSLSQFKNKIVVLDFYGYY
ncbi:Peroxiredoxin [Chthonomonas calidirosea]|uniref:peroxiredoxin family protein n=1 Tax=Chthonomonas calidirosea TaxID=454171 RepID=UPI0003A1F1E3|nr:Peroxiredoxin [Chthonomonas calidirosea]CEK20104.1 Peroxiredoxin [Chthonomonas calidirosea]